MWKINIVVLYGLNILYNIVVSFIKRWKLFVGLILFVKNEKKINM